MINSGSSGNTIGGTVSGTGNVISGNTGDGVEITGSGTTGNLVAGNLIGTNAADTAALANRNDGLEIDNSATGNTIGGGAADTDNVISGNTNYGVEINGSGTTGNLVAGNFIGTDVAGSAAIPDDIGVVIDSSASGNTIGGSTVSGAGNVISGNTLDGIYVEGIAAADNLLVGNVIGTNAAETAALANKNDGIIIESTGNTIGGTSAGYGNLISGNTGYGLVFSVATASGNLVEGNLIGTNGADTGSLGNGIGVGIVSASNTIGGTATGAGNVISGNPDDGVLIEASSATHNLVEGNFIGTNSVGAAAIANGVGVMIESGALSNTIGGTTALARNIISGNTVEGVGIDTPATGNIVEGDYIGTDVTGDVALANPIGVYIHSSDNTIGGTAAGAGNVIAGNADAVPLYDRSQVLIRNTGSTDNVVEGNLIGLGANGLAFSGPVNVGVWLDTGATGNTIGGTTAAARNVISGNLGGVQLNGDSDDVVEGNDIGTNIAGTAGIGNGTPGSGVTDENGTDDTIGGSVAGAGNVISGNAGNGVYILDSDAADNLIEGNFIGTDYTGTVRISNSNDIVIDDTGGGNTIGGATSVPGTGAGNIIAYSGHSGIAIANDTAGDVILGNAIIDNATNPSIPETGVSLSSDIDAQVGGTGAGDGNLISGNNGDGIAVQDSTNTLIQGNLIGTDAAGTSAFANRFDGVLIDSASTGSTVGGTAAGAGNVISGNTTDGVEITGSGTTGNVVAGNDIGTDITGTIAIPNVSDGVEIDTSASGNTIGGTTGTPGTGAGNVISGNTGDGVAIDVSGTSDNVVAGNEIGTNAAGTAALGNTSDGVYLSDTTGNTIGGTTSASGNVIAADGLHGIEFDDANSNLVEENYIGTDVTGNVALGVGHNGIDDLGLSNTFIGNVIDASGNIGIWIKEGSTLVQGNLIGLNAAGTAALGNSNAGIEIYSGDDNTIGGATASVRNVISGTTGTGVGIVIAVGTADNLIDGNYIGTNATGTAAVANVGDGIDVDGSSGNTIGGATGTAGTGAGDVISGNANYGMVLQDAAADNIVLGNIIGLNATGTAAVENGSSTDGDGVDISDSSSNTIGGTNVADRNIISGNYLRGVEINSGGGTASLLNLVEGNYIGTDITGTISLGNGLIPGYAGVYVAAAGNTIGGTVVGAGNVVSGSGSYGVRIDTSYGNSNLVAGNDIGTNAAGTVAFPSVNSGIFINLGSNNTIGGTVAAAANLVSGNRLGGIWITGNDNLVEGNDVGTDASGTVALANGGIGVEIYSGGIDNTIGGGITSAANVISGNTGYGIQVDGATTTGNILDDNFVGTGADGIGTVLNGGGALEITNGVAVLAQGTFTGNVLNQGTLGFWDAPSVITIVGNYTQSAAGILDVDLGGTSSSQYDQLLVSGTATLAGTLDVDLIDAFSIGLAEDFQVLTYDVVSGTFTTYEYPSGVTLYPDYTSTILYLFSTPTELVTNTADSGAGSLRQAITSADAVMNNLTAILFGIPASDPGYSTGVWTISPETALPAITEPVILDGTSQPGYAGTPIIVLVGTDAGSSASGLILDANGSSIRGLVIDDFGQDGLSVQGNDNTVAGDYLGVAATAMTAAGNALGIVVTGAGNTIGGLTATPGTGAGNLISANTNDGIEITGSGATGNLVAGNFIGTDVTGTVALANGTDGVEIDTGASGNIIGGTTAAARNIISANSDAGVYIDGANDNLVEGDYIGTDTSGTVALGNNSAAAEFAGGVFLQDGASGNTIGGLTATPGTGAGNLISGNTYAGVSIYGAPNNLVAGNLIGTNVTGSVALGNDSSYGNLSGGFGVTSYSSADTIVGEPGGGNVIAGNGLGTINGANVSLLRSSGSVVQSDIIGTDITGTIALSTTTYYGVLLQFGSYTVGGLTPTPGTGLGNVISGNSLGIYDINYTATTTVAIEGNIIGADATGTHAVPNGNYGVDLNDVSRATIGGTAAGAGNLISGNSVIGVFIDGSTATENLVAGNFIGTDITGKLAIGNLQGVVLDAGASNNTIGGLTTTPGTGAGNVISGNADAGVQIGVGVADTATSDNVIEGNLIGTDATGENALANLEWGVFSYGTDTTIGGTAAGARNVIAGNADNDVVISGSGATDDWVGGNSIGLDLAGTATLGSPGSNLTVESQGNTIGGTSAAARNVISGDGSAEIVLDYATGTGNLIEGNYIGTNASGTVGIATPLPTEIWEMNGSAGNTIGGTVAGAGNVVVGQEIPTKNTSSMLLSSNNLVAGNLIDSNPTGTAVIGQTEDGIVFSGSNNTVGGTVAAARNILPTDGIWLQSAASDNLVEGNICGLDITGTIKLAQFGVGIESDGPNNTIGGTTAAAANVMAGSSGGSVLTLSGSTSTGNLVEGNLVGTDITGTVSIRNAGAALYIDGGATNNTIGGTTAAARNVFSSSSYGVEILSNSPGNLLEGNFIGTDITGTQSLYNLRGVLIVAASNTIGGTASGAGNLISGNVGFGGADPNTGWGLWLEGSGATGNLVEGNLIGTDVTGENPLGNTTNAGVYIQGAPNNTIGGTAPGAGNVISGNRFGIYITLATATGNLVEGNFIGTDKTGTVAMGNGNPAEIPYGQGQGILILYAQSNTIGGTAAGAGNVISGNAQEGIEITDTASDNLVEGNRVGTNAAGTAALPNADGGIAIGSDDNTIGGTVAGAGNVISGNTTDGVDIGSSENLVAGNLIGTNAAGTAALGNSGDGVAIFSGASNNTIGGLTSTPGTAAGNVISGNSGDGVEITGSGTTGNLVAGNLIGTDDTGTAPLGNTGDGVEIDSDASNNSIGATTAGAGNTIAYNADDGVQVVGDGTTGNPIRGNSFSGNGVLSIELGTSGVPSTNVLGGAGTGPNDDENYPVLTIVSYAPGTGTTIAGNINTTPNTTVFIDFYTDNVEAPNGYGLGQTYIGSVTVNTTIDGNASFTFLSPTLPPNSIVTATATDPGNTSEFSLDEAEDNPPIAELVARPSLAGTPATTFNEDQTITFDGSGSYSPDGDSLTYTWDFNDGTAPITTATPTITHSYDYDGTYVVTLIVNDGHGGIESTFDILTIDKLPPTIAFNPLPASLAVGTTLNLSGTIDDPTPDLETVVLDWGDGSDPTTLNLPAGSTTFSASHDYASPLPGGATTATITATVTDSSNPAASPQPSPIGPLTPTPTFDVGGLSGSTSATLTVSQQSPTITGLNLSPTTVNVNGTVTLSGTVVDPNPLVSHMLTIQWGDTPATTTLFLPPGDLSFSSTHQYLNTPNDTLAGPYPISLTVVNSNGLTGAANTSVTVVDVSPVVQIQSLPNSTTGSLVSLIANATEPGPLNQLTYQWTLSTNGSTYATGTGETLTFTSVNGGVFTASVVVTDQDGATGQASDQVVIGPSAPNNTVSFNPAGAGLVTMTADGTTSNPFAPGNAIIYYAHGATNVVEAAPTLTTPVEFIGSTGGTNTLIGGAGNDTLVSVMGDDFVEGTTGNTDFVLILGHDPTLVASSGINTIDLSQTPQNITLNLGDQAVQTVDSDGDIVLLQGTFQNVIAGPGDDILTAANGVNGSLIGGGGNDIIYGGTTGNDSIVGGTGNSTITGGGGNDIIYGGTTGNDSIVGGTGNSTITGGGGNDIIYGGTTGNDSIVGGTGNSTITGGGGNDIIYGGTSGNDSIVGGSGNSTITGGGGNDIIYGGTTGNDSIVGGTGNSTITGGGGNDIIYGGTTGNDSIVGGTGNSTITGGGGNDIIYGGTSGNDSIVGGSGNTTITGGGGNDIIYGGTTGDDSIVGGTGNATITGGGGNDIIYGGPGDDSILGGTGYSTISGGGGNDIIFGGPNDWLIETDPVGNTATPTTVTLTNTSLTMPGYGTDTISGISNLVVGLGDGKILLDAHQDTLPLVLVAGTGDDTILAGTGDDTLYAGSGTDSLVGGGGNDTYVFGPLTQGNVTVNRRVDHEQYARFLTL